MWFTILKASKYSGVLRKLIPDFLQTINIGDSFKSSDIFEWVTKKKNDEYVNVDNNGNPYATGFPIKDQFPTKPSISFAIREHFKRDISSERILSGEGNNFSHNFMRIR